MSWFISSTNIINFAKNSMCLRVRSVLKSTEKHRERNKNSQTFDVDEYRTSSIRKERIALSKKNTELSNSIKKSK